LGKLLLLHTTEHKELKNTK